jgi:hypothetical protein
VFLKQKTFMPGPAQISGLAATSSSISGGTPLKK